MTTPHLASDLAGDLLFIRGSLNTDGAVDALGEFVDLVHAVLVPSPDRAKVRALQFALDCYRSEA